MTNNGSHGEISDAQDIKASLAGDGDAYARLVRRHQDRVASRMWRFTRNAGEHEELVQEVFVQAYLSLASFRGEVPLAHWLARIATRVGYRYWRQRSKQRIWHPVPVEELSDVLAAPSDRVQPEVAGETLFRLMQGLPPRDRLVLTLRYVEERSVEETADLTGWTQTMVKVQAWRARNKLKRLIQETGLEVEQ